MTPEEEIQKAGEARDVLRSRIFTEAKSNLLAQLDSKAVSAPVANQALHTQIILMRQAWAALETWLEQVVATGEMAQIKLSQEEDQEKRKRAFALFGR